MELQAGASMSTYRDRVGQVIGDLEVLGNHARTKRGRNGGRRIIWRCLDHSTGQERYLRTDQLIRLDRERLAAEAKT